MVRGIVPGWAYESGTASRRIAIADVGARTARRRLANGRSGRI
jgi:hypothetical protein